MTISVTCALSARPLPVTAALTSLGVWKCTSMSRRAAASAITPPAWAVPIAGRRVLVSEHPLDRDDVGQVGVHPVFDGVADGEQSLRRGAASAGVRTTSTSRAMTWRPWPLSMTDSPHRVRPGSTPITRTPTPSSEHLFESLAAAADESGQGHAAGFRSFRGRQEFDPAVLRRQRAPGRQQRFGGAQRPGEQESALEGADEPERDVAREGGVESPGGEVRRCRRRSSPRRSPARPAASSSTVSATSALTLATGHMLANPVAAMSSAAWVNTPSIAAPRSVYSSTIVGISSPYAAPALTSASRAICTLPPRKWW